MAKALDNKNYIAIADWMLDLNLNTRELLLYALIYGFSQDKESYCFASFDYVASWLGIENSANSVRYLKPLVDKKLVEKIPTKTKYNQLSYKYRTITNKGKILENPEVDYIIVQPWMIKTLNLKGKDLLIYALIHGYSRRGSDNYCIYKKDYFAKWLQCRKDNVGRQINQAINNGLIKEYKDGYKAIIPDNIQLPQIDSTFANKKITQIDSALPQSDSAASLKVIDNNISSSDNLLDNLFLNNNKKEVNKSNSNERDLSVVVNNSNLILINELTEAEKNILQIKINQDAIILKKYKKEEWVIKFLIAISKDKLRYLSVHSINQAKDKEFYINKTEKNLLELLKKYKNDVLVAKNEQLVQIYSEAISIYDPENRESEKIYKTKEAYLIGIIKNLLEKS